MILRELARLLELLLLIRLRWLALVADNCPCACFDKMRFVSMTTSMWGLSGAGSETYRDWLWTDLVTILSVV